ncbi:DUF3107 domain-containing protein [Nocardioides limicola]|uniref:DUF3107 domain-containing protein n=1 Tax=Nocardioides limicola TaxID=2803368 RepID=UPI00193C1E02|nr:DUF3107 domain-containing protein [Nocardioides sp. DJM-14]
MEVKIGVQNAARELTVDVAAEADEVAALVSAAVESGGVLALTDVKGRRTMVPAAKLAYVEIGSSTVGTVGFRS